MSIQQNFPAISPSLSLNFARAKRLDPRITFTRTSSATRVNEQGLIEVVSADTPRFDHEYDASTGVIKSLGLLIEESRSNLITYSEDFTNAYWISRSNTTINLVNDSTNPLGLNQVNEIVISNTEVGYILTSSVSITSGTTYTTSYFARFDNSTTRFYYRPPLSSTSNVVLGNFDGISIEVLQGSDTIFDNYGYEIYSNNWVRLWFTWTADQASNSSGQIGAVGTSNTDPLFVGAQLEEGSFPTSYIPTSGSTVTRTADNASMVGENFSSWYNQSEGSICCNFRFSQSASVRTDETSIYNIKNGDNTLQEQIRLSRNLANNRLRLRYRVDNVDRTVIFSPIDSSDINVDIKTAVSYGSGNQSIVDRGILTTGTSDLVPSPDNLVLGRFRPGSDVVSLNGHISQLTYYPKRLPNAFLQNLTK